MAKGRLELWRDNQVTDLVWQSCGGNTFLWRIFNYLFREIWLLVTHKSRWKTVPLKTRCMYVSVQSNCSHGSGLSRTFSPLQSFHKEEWWGVWTWTKWRCFYTSLMSPSLLPILFCFKDSLTFLVEKLQGKTDRERIFYLLVLSPNACNGQGHARQEPGAPPDLPICRGHHHLLLPRCTGRRLGQHLKGMQMFQAGA